VKPFFTCGAAGVLCMILMINQTSFFHIHFLILLSLLFSVSTAFESGMRSSAYWTVDLVGGPVVFVQSIFVIGLRLLGQKMLDPYGEDIEDLSVMHYINFTWQMSNRTLAAQTPESLSAEQEEMICQKSQSIGAAWEDKDDTNHHAPPLYVSDSESEKSDHLAWGARYITQSFW
jgi:hypothetical protein